MKKQLIFAISMLTVLALALTACGGGSQTTPTTVTGGGFETTVPTMPAMETQPAVETSVPLPTGGATGAVPTVEGTSAAAAPTAAETGVAGTGVAVTGPIDCMGAAKGDTVSMLYQWSGVEEEKLNSVLKPLADACGIAFKPESTRDQALLDTRVKAGTPPDVAFWNVVQMRQYVDQLKTMQDLGVNAGNYPQSWQAQGSINGKWVGLPVKTDIKSIVWYSPTNFQALGYQVPKTWDELNTLVEKMVADGQVPWSMGFESGGATGWTGSDWIEDLLLVKQGPDFVRGLIDGSKKYDDPAVKEVYQIYGKWATDPKYTVGGKQGTLSTAFADAVYNVFSDPPKAMMVRQSGFAGGLIAAQYPNLKFGTDYDFFQLPDVKGMQTGADWMMAFSDKPAVKALYAYISSAAGAEAWAKAAFDISPNTAAAGKYSDPSLGKRADVLYGSKDTVPDIGDTIPGGFGTAEWTGIVNYVNGGNLDQILATIAGAQMAAVGNGGTAVPATGGTPAPAGTATKKP